MKSRMRTCESSSMRSSGTRSTRIRTAISVKSHEGSRATIRNTRQLWEVTGGEEVSNDIIPSGTGRNDDRSPASATLLQQLHLLLHRAVEASAYGHGSKQ